MPVNVQLHVRAEPHGTAACRAILSVHAFLNADGDIYELTFLESRGQNSTRQPREPVRSEWIETVTGLPDLRPPPTRKGSADHRDRHFTTV